MKKVIKTEDAPLPIGPYSQAILAGNTLYASGVIAIHPKTNELVIKDIESETEQVMQNMKAVLNAAEMDFEDVVKCSIFLSDMENFGKVNAIYGNYFCGEAPPARETVEVANLPKYVNVEISCIAIK